jgi:hypothetical protein
MPPQCLFAVVGFRQQFSKIFLVRSATYLLGIINYALGQGALGLYLQRSGVPAIRAAGTMLFLMVVNLKVILFVASFALLTGGYPKTAHVNLSPLGYGMLVGMRLYLVTIGLQPRWLRHYRRLMPLLEAGLRGHLRAAAGRLPHILVLVITYWGALRLWGIQVPLAQGVAMVIRGFAHRCPAYYPRGFGHHPGCSSFSVQPVCALALLGGQGCGSVSLRPDLLLPGDGGPGSFRLLVLV